MSLISILKRSYYLRKIQGTFYCIQIAILGEKKWIEKNYKHTHGKKIDLKEPICLNEKINWLKLYYYKDFYRKCCDKFYVHEYLRDKLGHDLAPRMIFFTKNIKELSNENIPEYPCIIKVSNGTGTNLVVHNKNQYSNKFLQHYFKTQMVVARINATREHQYYDKTPYIIVEELLKDDKGSIPNDIKVFCFNGRIEFIYCSVDRAGENVRQVYDIDWNRLHFIWVPNADEKLFKKYDKSKSISCPRNFEKMKEIALKISEDFPFVRVDFYEANNRIYIGEITLHHGSGYDRFYPGKYDQYYGEKLKLPKANRRAK